MGITGVLSWRIGVRRILAKSPLGNNTLRVLPIVLRAFCTILNNLIDRVLPVSSDISHDVVEVVSAWRVRGTL